MTKQERNKSFNDGVDASANSLEAFRQKPKDDKTELAPTSVTFNKLIDEFQKHIKTGKKVV